MLNTPALRELFKFIRDKLRAVVANQLLRYAVSGEVSFQLLNDIVEDLVSFRRSSSQKLDL